MRGKVGRPGMWESCRQKLIVKGQSQFLTAPVLAKPLQFSNLLLTTDDYEDGLSVPNAGDSDTRLMEMLAAQAAHRDDGTTIEDEDAVSICGNSHDLGDAEMDD